MGAGLQVFKDTGQLVFDSSLCRGGVCAGIISIPVAGGTFQFPAMPAGRGQRVVFADTNKRPYTYSEPNSVPTFTFIASQSVYATFAGVFFL